MRRKMQTPKRRTARKGTLLKVSCDCVVYSFNLFSFPPPPSSGTCLSPSLSVRGPGTLVVRNENVCVYFCIFYMFDYLCVSVAVFMSCTCFEVFIYVIVFVYVCFVLFKYLWMSMCVSLVRCTNSISAVFGNVSFLSPFSSLIFD